MEEHNKKLSLVYSGKPPVPFVFVTEAWTTDFELAKIRVFASKRLLLLSGTYRRHDTSGPEVRLDDLAFLIDIAHLKAYYVPHPDSYFMNLLKIGAVEALNGLLLPVNGGPNEEELLRLAARWAPELALLV